MPEILSNKNKDRILLLSYAFPPMQVQMTAAVYKPMAAIARAGYSVDVICADSFCKELPIDNSLLPFADKTFGSVTRLRPSTQILSRLRQSSRIFSRIPDLMTVLQEVAYSTLMDTDLSQYAAVMTWSPFHSVNSVMARVKKNRPKVPWVAQFSDPWAGNPLEISALTKYWNRYNEPRAVSAANHIVHSSAYSRDLMLKNNPALSNQKTSVIPHAFDIRLYPDRPKSVNEKIVIRYVGVLYGRRSPDSLFQALSIMLGKRPDLIGQIVVEFVGSIPSEMLQTPAALSLPPDIIRVVGNVSFVDSLELMYDADILILIEANIKQNLFLPSKLSDYIGAQTPMVGLVPNGGSGDAFQELGAWHAKPDDLLGIATAIEGAVNYVKDRSSKKWCNSDFQNAFNGKQVASAFIEIIQKL